MTTTSEKNDLLAMIANAEADVDFETHHTVDPQFDPAERPMTTGESARALGIPRDSFLRLAAIYDLRPIPCSQEYQGRRRPFLVWDREELVEIVDSTSTVEIRTANGMQLGTEAETEDAAQLDLACTNERVEQDLADWEQERERTKLAWHA